MKTSVFIILLLGQILMGVLHACELSSSNSQLTSFSSSKLSSSIVISEYLSTSKDCSTEKSESYNGPGEVCSVHCYSCKMFLEFKYLQFSFILSSLAVSNFYYLSTIYNSYLSIDLQPPINSI